MKFHKKGGMFDIIMVIIIVFILVVCTVFYFFAQNTLYTALQQQAPKLQKNFQENVSQIMSDSVGGTSRAFQSLPWITAILIIAYFVSILITAFFVKTHPTMFAAHWFIVIIAGIVSVYVSNVYETLMTNPILSDSWMQFAGANYIFLYLPIWVVVIGLAAGGFMATQIEWGNVNA